VWLLLHSNNPKTGNQRSFTAFNVLLLLQRNNQNGNMMQISILSNTFTGSAAEFYIDPYN
jgi:hypothetical protein